MILWLPECLYLGYIITVLLTFLSSPFTGRNAAIGLYVCLCMYMVCRKCVPKAPLYAEYSYCCSSEVWYKAKIQMVHTVTFCTRIPFSNFTPIGQCTLKLVDLLPLQLARDIGLAEQPIRNRLLELPGSVNNYNTVQSIFVQWIVSHSNGISMVYISGTPASSTN